MSDVKKPEGVEYWGFGDLSGNEIKDTVGNVRLTKECKLPWSSDAVICAAEEEKLSQANGVVPAPPRLLFGTVVASHTKPDGIGVAFKALSPTNAIQPPIPIPIVNGIQSPPRTPQLPSATSPPPSLPKETPSVVITPPTPSRSIISPNSTTAPSSSPAPPSPEPTVSQAPSVAPISPTISTQVQPQPPSITSPTKSTSDQPNGAPISPSSTTSETPSVKWGTKSWADILKKTSNSNNQAVPIATAPKPNNVVQPRNKQTALVEMLTEFKASFEGKSIRPRGLINNGNMCFMNAILQPLVHCVPFYNFFMALRKDLPYSFSGKTPLIDSLIIFLNEFREEQPGQAFDPKIEEDSDAFAPEYVYDTLRELQKIDSIKGRQEDAEEFLGFLLNGLHEELLALQKRSGKPPQENNSDDTWIEVGPKNKTMVTRRTEVGESPISKIFAGQMRSILRYQGSKDSVKVEPFQSLQLDITPENVHTIEDALLNLTIPEILEDGFTSPTKGVRVDATKQNYIENLPVICILHLKRFIYDAKLGVTQKLHKHVGYSTTLKIRPEIVSPSARLRKQPMEYHLFAVVYHHGKLAAGGHYTCDVRRRSGEWLRIDDTVITPIREEDVMQEKPDRQA
ncbi:hypothetical protein HK102_013590, partial [Quaeritorhiza haematococci]